MRGALFNLAARVYEHAAARDGWAWYCVEVNAGRLLYALDPYPLRHG